MCVVQLTTMFHGRDASRTGTSQLCLPNFAFVMADSDISQPPIVGKVQSLTKGHDDVVKNGAQLEAKSLSNRISSDLI